MDHAKIMISTIFLGPGDDVDRRLRELGLEPIYRPFAGKRKEEELIDLLRGVVGVIVSSDPFTARVLQTADGLKVISRTGVGYDAIDVGAATARGIVVCTTPGVNRHAVADLALALILCCARKLAQNLAEVRRGGWTRHEGVDLQGKTLGLVGLGTIGKEVALRAKAFGIDILAYDIVHDLPFAERLGIVYTSWRT